MLQSDAPPVENFWLRHCINAAVHKSSSRDASEQVLIRSEVSSSLAPRPRRYMYTATTGSWDGQRLRPSDIVMHSTQPEARATATLTMYRVRQKSKLLILSEYVNKSETIRGM